MGLVRDYTREGGVQHPISRRWEWRDHRGILHRVDGPAVIDATGYQAWYLHGLLHRVDGPAVIYPNGYQAWYRHNRRYRADGPAIIRADGSTAWYVQGRNITTEVKSWMQAHDITWPFTPEQLVEFQLRWL